ncbi:MAG: type I-U CRISPR-associated protein Csx17 [Actinobacteria bacterium]|nr:type I-U CRISPR-associated protein Csx17 [Actinomycetota bacterium]
MTDYEHRLAGCRPEPLGSYLKALGVLRLVAEQADPGASGRWASDGFVLSSTMDDEALARFFLDAYRPTPLLSPWNSSSGFGPEGAGELAVIEASTDPRLQPYREAITVARELLADDPGGGRSKEELLAECRSRMPDACVAWLDAAAVLTDGRPVFPPLLGTGGNDGRLEFSRNFHQRVLDVLGLTTSRGHDCAAWLDDALHDLDRSSGLRGRSPGQFDPGAAGGVNSAPGGAAESVLNPWDWVLLLEGSLLLASGSARRLAAGASGRAAAPFTVDASAGGYASASDAEGTRGELWAPLWSRPAGVSEIRRLFAEGRADWRQGHARSGLDLAKAAASLGVDRGIEAFSRHAFVERFGLSTVAVAVGRVAVRDRSAVAPLAELDGWLDRVRRGGNPPAAVSAGLRAVDRASFELAAEGGGDRLLRVLIEAARLEAAVGRSTSFRDKAGLLPLRGLDAQRWMHALDEQDLGPEVRLAACLASGRDQLAGATARGGPGALRLLLRPIKVDPRGRLAWTDAPAPVDGLGRRPVPVVLADAHSRRVVELMQEQRLAGHPDQLGISTHFRVARPAVLADVADLASGRIDECRLGEALAACLLLDWPSNADSVGASTRAGAAVPPSLAVLGPFFAFQPATSSVSSDDSWHERLRRVALRPGAAWPALLAADRLQPVLAAAVRRLRIAGLEPVPRNAARMAAGLAAGGGPRLSAALLCRLSSRDRIALLRQVCPDSDLSSGTGPEARPFPPPQ